MGQWNCRNPLEEERERVKKALQPLAETTLPETGPIEAAAEELSFVVEEQMAELKMAFEPLGEEQVGLETQVSADQSPWQSSDLTKLVFDSRKGTELESKKWRRRTSCRGGSVDIEGRKPFNLNCTQCSYTGATWNRNTVMLGHVLRCRRLRPFACSHFPETFVKLANAKKHTLKKGARVVIPNRCGLPVTN